MPLTKITTPVSGDPSVLDALGDLIPIKDAPKFIIGRPSLATLYRWMQRGINGIKLRTVAVGGRRYVSEAEILLFIERTTAASDGEQLPAKTSGQRSVAIARATRELNDAGI